MVGTTKDETEDGCLLFFEKIEKIRVKYLLHSFLVFHEATICTTQQLLVEDLVDILAP